MKPSEIRLRGDREDCHPRHKQAGTAKSKVIAASRHWGGRARGEWSMAAILPFPLLLSPNFSVLSLYIGWRSCVLKPPLYLRCTSALYLEDWLTASVKQVKYFSYHSDKHYD